MRPKERRLATATRLRIAVVAIAVLSIVASLESASVAKTLARQSPDPFGIGIALARFAPLLAHLPSGARLGYLSDLEGERATLAFLQAQYALAPCLLVQLPAKDPPELAVGNFSRPENAAREATAQGYLIAVDFGHGVFLLRRGKDR